MALDFLENDEAAAQTPEQVLESTIDIRSISWQALLDYARAVRLATLESCGRRGTTSADADFYRGQIAALSIFAAVDQRIRARRPTGE